jgi:uncharacterized protein (TIRG00374 family)
VKHHLTRNVWVRLAVVLPAAVAITLLLWLRGPNWGLVGDAFAAVRWEWVAIAIGMNLISVVVRALAWRTVINAALPEPHPSPLIVFSAFCVGLLANAVLPGRIGELARVAVLNRHMPDRRAGWATLVGTVFVHRLFDLVPVMILTAWVLATAKIPHWAIASLIVIVGLGITLFALAYAGARRPAIPRLDERIGTVQRVIQMARQGLRVMRKPLPAAIAIAFQSLGWFFQLLAVWSTMHAFHIYEPLSAAGLVLLLMNVVTIVPLWPGNVGALQGAIALALRDYGVPYARGLAFGFGLQAIEASVGIGCGLVFLAREGLSFAMLRVMPEAVQAEMPPETEPVQEREEPARAGVGS